MEKQMTTQEQLEREIQERRQNSPLMAIAQEAAEACFNEHGKQSMSQEERELEGLGIRISEWNTWNGLPIMKIARAALEDANFHTEAGIIAQWIARYESK